MSQSCQLKKNKISRNLILLMTNNMNFEHMEYQVFHFSETDFGHAHVWKKKMILKDQN